MIDPPSCPANGKPEKGREARADVRGTRKALVELTVFGTVQAEDKERGAINPAFGKSRAVQEAARNWLADYCVWGK